MGWVRPFGVELGPLLGPARGVHQLRSVFRGVCFGRHETTDLELVRTRGIRLSN